MVWLFFFSSDLILLLIYSKESDLNWEEAYLLFTVAYIKRGSWALKEGYGILFSVSAF